LRCGARDRAPFSRAVRRLSRPGPVDSEALGAAAQSPRGYLPRIWWMILRRVWVKNSEHNLSLLAAAVAFYAFLSFVPLMGALIMSYGLIADPASVADHMRLLIDLIPADAAGLVHSQLRQLTQSAADRKGLGLAVALLMALYGASRASGAMITSLNIIYEERDRRSYLRWSLVSATLAAGAIVVGIVGLTAASLLSVSGSLIPHGGPVTALVLRISSWLLAAGLCMVTMGGIYRFAPNRADARWQWLSLGSFVATLLWLGATILFGIYVARFGNYDATYGSLGAVVVLLLWLYLSAYAVLLGGLINAETERQTARDTTTGRPLPMGERGATVADMSAALQAAENDGREWKIP
jgi:membrane protein